MAIWDDSYGMECDSARVLASSALDGQLEADEVRQLDAHLADCEPCSYWNDSLADLTRRSRVGASAGPSVMPAVPPHASRNKVLRVALGWAGVLLVVWHAPEVVTAGGELAVHLARHQAGFALALGIGFLLVALRPDRAYGVLPLAATFTVVLAVVAVIDVANGVSTLAVETRHLLEIGGLLIMWVLGAEMGPGRRPGRRPDQGVSGFRRRFRV